MAPVCSNCNGTDFVWANELKTGMTGASLSLRSRGEVPLGTRICRTCGHADLFLRDISLLHQPHNWKPGEFVPISPKPPAPRPPSAPSPAGPSPTPEPLAPAPPPPPLEPAPEPPMAPEPALEPEPAVAPAPSDEAAATDPAPAPDEAAPKPKSPRRRASKTKSG